MAAWTRVAQCEEGGQWTQRGPVYSGALGISRTNWAAYAPAGWPADAADATPAQQVYVAQLIQHDAGLDGQVPDQDGVCRPW